MQRRLLARLMVRPLTFSGNETDEERLAMLQLYTAKLVMQGGKLYRPGVMEWHLTAEGAEKAKALR